MTDIYKNQKRLINPGTSMPIANYSQIVNLYEKYTVGDIIRSYQHNESSESCFT